MSRKKDFDDWAQDQQHRNHKIKHSKNIPGRGMRVINTWYDESDIEEELSDILDEYVQEKTR